MGLRVIHACLTSGEENDGVNNTCPKASMERENNYLNVSLLAEPTVTRGLAILLQALLLADFNLSASA